MRNPRKTCPAELESRTTPETGCALHVPPKELAGSLLYRAQRHQTAVRFPVWWHAAVPFALLRNPRKTAAMLIAPPKGRTRFLP